MQPNFDTDIEKMIKSKTIKSLVDAQEYLSEANKKLNEILWAWSSAIDDIDDAIRILNDEAEFAGTAQELQNLRADSTFREALVNMQSVVSRANMKVKMGDPNW